MSIPRVIFLKRKETFSSEDLKEKQQEKGVLLSAPLGSNYIDFPFSGLIYYNNSTFYALISQGKRALISSLLKNLKLFLKGISQGFFTEFRIIGLGFRVKKSGFLMTRSLKFDLGYSHTIRLILPRNVRIARVKRRFFIFSNDLNTVNIFSRQIKLLKQLNPYKLRGLKISDEELKMKPGKKQTKR